MFEDKNGHKTYHDLGCSFLRLSVLNTDCPPFVPLPNEMILYHAVKQAVISEGLFYNTDVDARVIEILGDNVTPDEILAGRDKVEGGWLGYMVYHMRKVVENNAKTIANLQALDDPRLVVGLKIKKTSINAIRYSTLEVTKIDKETGLVTLLCSRRGTSAKHQYSVGANSNYIQDYLKGLPLPTGVTHIAGDGINTFIIEPSRARNAELTYQAA